MEIKFDEKLVSELLMRSNILKEERKKLNEQKLSIVSKISSMNLKIQESNSLRDKIMRIDLCPTCLQDVGDSYKSNIINSADSEISRCKNENSHLTIEKNQIDLTLLKIEEEIYSIEKKINEQNLLKLKSSEIEDKNKRMNDLKKPSESLEKDIEILTSHLEILTKDVFELNKYENIFEVKMKTLDSALASERSAEIKVAELKKEIEVFSRQIEEMRERILKTEEVKKRVEYLLRLETWISKSFAPLISLVEKNVMTRLKSEFSSLFTKWFSMLVSETFEVRLDDSFTPVINYQDYEIDYSYLSGGERTAIALAYRLAFNQVVNSLLSKIKTRDLVILDEPTDGFSEAQLDKMRDVLKQLNSRQLIIVSHEQKIESFVENVIRLNKEHGSSKISSQEFI